MDKDKYLALLKELAGPLSDYERRMAEFYHGVGIPALICGVQIGKNRRETQEAAHA